MKKIIASAGLVAVGAVTLNAQYAPGLTRMEASKPWSVSASLRGFYDDNYNTAPEHPTSPFVPKAKNSFGLEFSPAAALNFPMEQTYAHLDYVYSLRYYENRPNNSTDQSHAVNGKLDHRFSEQYKVTLDESFVYTQEPEILETVQTGLLLRTRSNADALRNRIGVGFIGNLTDKASVELGYANTWYDYRESGDFSYSALLDRVQHLFTVQPRWQIEENLHGFIGYKYGIDNFTSDNLISATLRGKDRSSDSHFFYVGAEKALSTQLNGQAQVGAEYTTYDLGPSEWNPYADASLTYTYLPGSYVQAGFRHSRNPTDVVGNGAGDNITLDAESSTLYGQLSHRIAPPLQGNLVAQYQHSTFNGGTFNDEADNFFLVGVNLEYKFTENWSSEVGYNFDKLNSDITDRGFTRNRVYVGVRASF